MTNDYLWLHISSKSWPNIFQFESLKSLRPMLLSCIKSVDWQNWRLKNNEMFNWGKDRREEWSHMCVLLEELITCVTKSTMSFQEIKRQLHVWFKTRQKHARLETCGRKGIFFVCTQLNALEGIQMWLFIDLQVFCYFCLNWGIVFYNFLANIIMNLSFMLLLTNNKVIRINKLKRNRLFRWSFFCLPLRLWE